MATIADLFSFIDSQKRKLSDTVANPGASLMQMLGQMNDQARNLNQQTALAAQEGLKYGPASQTLANTIASAYNPVGMTVWHGSPYKFTAFDPRKIGTGEGAQAYGHGLYVAENPAVAESYKTALSNPEVVLKSGERISNPPLGSGADVAKAWLEEAYLNKEKNPFDVAINKITKLRKAANNPKQFDEAVNVLHDWKNQGATVDTGGNLYKIDLPDEHIDKMLDWDKPLSQQPENVKSALKNIADKFPSIPDFDLKKWMDADPLASTWHNVLNRDLGVSQPDIASTLSNQGIPGIKYNDSGSRTGPTTYHVGSPTEGFGQYTQHANKLDALNQLSILKNLGFTDAEFKEQVAPQTRNFVIFPSHEGILKIENINGNPVP